MGRVWIQRRRGNGSSTSFPDCGPDRATTFRPRKTLRVVAVTRPKVLVVGAAAVMMLTGCANFYRGFRDFHTGWRTGEVVAIGGADVLPRGARTDCRDAASAEERATRRFAILVDRSAGRRHAHVVMLNKDALVMPGDIVYANIERCGTSVRVLSHGPAP